MTVAKLMTGRDGPISSIEMALTDTYQRAKARFEIQQKRADGSKKRR